MLYSSAASRRSRRNRPPRAREFAVAARGPALSLALGGIFFGVWKLIDHPTSSVAFACSDSPRCGSNLVVGVFNMLPGLPLDGGRIFRARDLAITGRPLSATDAAAWTGRALAVRRSSWSPVALTGGEFGRC